MGHKSKSNDISSEAIAAFIEGHATAAESREILDSLVEDADLRDLMHISHKVDEELGEEKDTVDLIPMTAVAANCDEHNYCCLECEKFILNKRKIKFDEQEMLRRATENRWQKESGTALYNIGRQLEATGLIVTRQYHGTIKDIVEALKQGDDIIVAVDGGELTGDRLKEIYEDLYVGQIPDHAVVVLSCDEAKGVITIFDPDSEHKEDIYPISQFVDAWNDSKNYLVTITSNKMKKYVPKPIDLSDVVLTEDLNDLREAIAENAHEIWAEKRQAEGWTYGPERNDLLKQTPDMVPYSQLPDSEKEYDRKMAMKTIKLLKKLGYDLIKREDTELYHVLRRRILHAEEEYHCRRCGNVIYKHQVFCDQCGLELKIDWNLK